MSELRFKGVREGDFVRLKHRAHEEYCEFEVHSVEADNVEVKYLIPTHRPHRGFYFETEWELEAVLERRGPT